MESPEVERLPMLSVTPVPVQIQIQEGVVHRQESRCCGHSVKEHLRGILNIVLWGWIAFVLICYFYLKNFYWSAYVLIGIYLIYALEVICGDTRKYLTNKEDTESCMVLIDRVKANPPELTFYCECYHYETVHTTRTEHYTDSNGNRQTRTIHETHQKRVVTSTNSSVFHYTSWWDESGQVTIEIATYNCVRVEFDKQWRFANEETRMEYERQKHCFIEANKYRDTHFDFSERYEIRDFKDKVMSVRDPSQLSGCVGIGPFLLVSLVLLAAYPYRLWLENKTPKANFCFRKAMSCSTMKF